MSKLAQIVTYTPFIVFVSSCIVSTLLVYFQKYPRIEGVLGFFQRLLGLLSFWGYQDSATNFKLPLTMPAPPPDHPALMALSAGQVATKAP